MFYYPAQCARGKVIGFVCRLFVSTKIVRSEDSGITVVGKCDQIVGSGEKLSSSCFLMLGTRQGRYILCDYIGHAYRPHPAIQGVDSAAHARAQCR